MRDLTLKELTRFKEELELQIERAKEQEPIGDGNAVFLGDMTDEEREEYIEQVDRGWGGFYKKIKNIGK